MDIRAAKPLENVVILINLTVRLSDFFHYVTRFEELDIKTA